MVKDQRVVFGKGDSSEHVAHDANTTRNYLICDAFSATFSENITNVHCSPEHCDDLLNSSRFYDVFLFFVTDVH
jgi:hypothetical protein